MKKALLITGIGLIIFSTISIINITEGQSGAGLYGMLTFYLIMLLVSGILIYFGTRETKKKNYFRTQINTNQSNTNQSNTNQSNTNQSNKYDSNHQNLKELHEQGVLTDDEYYEKSALLKMERLERELKLMPEYEKLKSLYDEKILTKKEFDKKVEKISKNNTIKSKQYSSDNLNFNIADDLSEGFYLITDTEINYGFVNNDYQVVIRPRYEFAESFSSGLALVRIDGKFGFINKDGFLIINNEFNDAESFNGETALVKKQNDKYYIDKNGKRV